MLGLDHAIVGLSHGGGTVVLVGAVVPSMRHASLIEPDVEPQTVVHGERDEDLAGEPSAPVLAGVEEVPPAVGARATGSSTRRRATRRRSSRTCAGRC